MNLRHIVFSLKLRAIHRFTSTATAVEDITALQEGKLGKGLKEFLSAEIIEKGKTKESLVVVDSKLGMWEHLHRRALVRTSNRFAW